MYTYTWKVRTGDTDFTGLVYTPEVIDYICRGMQDLLEEINFSPRDSYERGIVYPMVHVEADYHEPFGIYDYVEISYQPSFNETSISFGAAGDLDGTTVFEGTLVVACIDVETRESVPVPDDIRQALRSYM